MERPVNLYKHILIGTPVKNSKPYLENYARQLVGLDYPKDKISVAIIENDSEDKSWEFLKSKTLPHLKKFPYRAVHLEKRDLGFKLSHHSRHLKEMSINRQKSIDMTRQYIVDKFLLDNNYILWFDSDLEQVPPASLKIVLSYDADIVVPLFKLKTSEVYDASSYSNGRYVGKLIKEDRQRETWPLECTNCHFLMRREVFDRGYIYWSDKIPRADQDFMKYRRFRVANSVYTFSNKNMTAILTTKLVILHVAVGGTQPIKRR